MCRHAVSRRDFFRDMAIGVSGMSILGLAARRAAWAQAAAPGAATDLFEIQNVADGVYFAFARPQAVGNCNAAIFVNSADVLQAYVVVRHAAHIVVQVALQQPHQEIYFGLGAPQIVLKRERIQSEPGNLDPGGGFNNVLHRLSALLVPQEALKAAFARPAPVAIHDDGNVPRQTAGIEPAVDCLLFRRQQFHVAGWREWQEKASSNIDRSTGGYTPQNGAMSSPI